MKDTNELNLEMEKIKGEIKLINQTINVIKDNHLEFHEVPRFLASDIDEGRAKILGEWWDIECECDYNNITENTVNNNTRHGIYLFGTSSAVHCDWNEISNNTVFNNQYDGIRLENYCDNNTIKWNDVRNNGESGSVGIYLLVDCDWNFIVNNTICNDNFIPLFLQCQ